MISKAFAYIDENVHQFTAELQEFLSFPSISGDIVHNTDVRRCATWLKTHFERLGLHSCLIETAGNPIVWALAKGQTSKMLIICGHYDVQPVDPIDKWHSEPFRPMLQNGFIYARGATDDKGQLFAHIKAVESFVKTTGQLPCHVLFLIEGEEESGGTSLHDYIKNHQNELDADAVVISDTTMYGEGVPAVTYGLRGLIAIEVSVKTAEYDLHSGFFGGIAPNPCILLSRLVTECIGPDGKIVIPGFYDNVRPLEEWERRNIDRLQRESKLSKKPPPQQPIGEVSSSTLERLWSQPSFDVNGMIGGHTSKGIKTIIPSFAEAKISLRLVPDQDPSCVADLVKRYLLSNCPDCASLEIQGPCAIAKPILFDVSDPILRAAEEALKQGFEVDPVLIRAGCSIPVVSTFYEHLKTPVVLMGFGLESDGAHAPNERFSISNFICGAKSSASFMSSL